MMVRALALMLALSGLASATTIERPLKTCNARTYVEEVLLGCTTILDSEVDGDIGGIYDDYNGNIDNSNIAGSAAIAGSKLNLTNEVETTDLVDQAVTTAKLDDGAVTRAKLGTAGYGTAVCSSGTYTTEAEVASVAITGTGGPVTLLADCAASVILVGTSGKTITWRWKRDGTLVCGTTVTLSGPTATSVQVPAPVPPCVDAAPSVGAHTYSVTVETTGTVQITVGFSGSIYVKEDLR